MVDNVSGLLAIWGQPIVRFYRFLRPVVASLGRGVALKNAFHALILEDVHLPRYMPSCAPELRIQIFRIKSTNAAVIRCKCVVKCIKSDSALQVIECRTVLVNILKVKAHKYLFLSCDPLLVQYYYLVYHSNELSIWNLHYWMRTTRRHLQTSKSHCLLLL